jgi:hypothetical protein
MQVFTSQIIYRIKCEGVVSEQYEEQWRIVHANDERDALARAKEVAILEEATFIDRHGRTVCWELIGVKSIQQVDLQHGTLLFSEVKEIEPIADPVWTENELAC